MKPASIRGFSGAGVLGAALGAALAVSPVAAQTHHSRTPVQLPPDIAAAWIAQLSPGSGVVPGYYRPNLAAPVEQSGRDYSDGVVLGVERPVIVEERHYLVPVEPRRHYRYGVRPAPVARVARPARSADTARIARRSAAATPARSIDPNYLPTTVRYDGGQAPGTVVIDPSSKYLYYVEKNGMARRYGVGVGKPGFSWRGTHPITRKAEWPGWTPPKEMIARERRKGRVLPAHMDGGPGNPLGARALYLGSTLYRIHGTNQPWTIGHAVSSGCIRMRNEDVKDLYNRVRVGTTVVVL